MRSRMMPDRMKPTHRFARILAGLLLAVVPGLAGDGTDGSPEQLGSVLRALLAAVPEGGRGLAVGHTPLIEKAVRGLAGPEIEQLSECEGVLLTEEAGDIRVEELRLS